MKSAWIFLNSTSDLNFLHSPSLGQIHWCKLLNINKISSLLYCVLPNYACLNKEITQIYGEEGPEIKYARLYIWFLTMLSWVIVIFENLLTTFYVSILSKHKLLFHDNQNWKKKTQFSLWFSNISFFCVLRFLNECDQVIHRMFSWINYKNSTEKKISV